MAQGYYEGHYAPPSEHARAGQPAAASGGVVRFVNVAGAVVSLALVLGVGVWSYRLMVRDVAGVPVIRAMGGPMRVVPDNPGGQQALFQGLAVNAVATEGGAQTPAQTVVLAPAPIDLAREDRSTGALAQAAPIAAPAAAPPMPSYATLTEPVEDLGAQTIPASVPGLARSPRPPSRPVALAVSAPQSVAPAGTDAQAEALLQDLVTRLGAPRATDVDPASLPFGTRMVQLGIFDDDASARAAWESLAARFPAYLDGRPRVIGPATSSGRVFYRLRVLGFNDEPEARRFCSVFLAANLDCTPTMVR